MSISSKIFESVSFKSGKEIKESQESERFLADVKTSLRALADGNAIEAYNMPNGGSFYFTVDKREDSNIDKNVLEVLSKEFPEYDINVSLEDEDVRTDVIIDMTRKDEAMNEDVTITADGEGVELVTDEPVAIVQAEEPTEGVADAVPAEEVIEENATEDYFGTEEIDREAFVSLHKDKNGKYLVINDGNVVREFEAESDEEAKKEFRASLEEATAYTAEELKDKYGTDDVEIINAGKEPEERVELKEEDIDQEILEFLESAYEDEEEEEVKEIPICVYCEKPIEGEVFNNDKGEPCHNTCYSATDDLEKDKEVEETEDLEEAEVPASQAGFAHTKYEEVMKDIEGIAELKANDPENALYSELLDAYDKVLEVLKKEIEEQPVTVVAEPAEVPVEEPVETIEEPVEQVEVEPSSEEINIENV